MRNVNFNNSDNLKEFILKLTSNSDPSAVRKLVLEYARSVSKAEGAAFIIRKKDYCYYVDENAIGPLWKGQQIPIAECISGWVMRNKQALRVMDIFSDKRIPKEVYKSTFVKSLLIVPIKSSAPIGAIGIYWAEKNQPTLELQNTIQNIADTAAIVMENIHAKLPEYVKALSDERRRFAAIVQAAQVGVWEWDIINNEVIWTDKAYQLTGIEKTNSVKTFEEIKEIVHPDDLQLWTTKLNECLEKGVLN